MTARRLERSGQELVKLRVDGEELPAVRGEPVAIALLAAGRTVLGRSVKYHRPRGAACFAGRCDGCLMRVDGVPSVRTCRLPARDGLVLETQNVLGSAELDLLSAADWFFPGGMNHHEMFTWAKPVNQVMQLVAREIAGVGTLPDEPTAAAPLAHRELDVLVIGAGAAGLATARGLASDGVSVLVLDEEPAPGGWLAHATNAGGARRAAELTTAATDAGAEIMLGTAALGIFDEPEEGRVALAASHASAVRVRARAWVLAVGRQEGAAAFEGTDLPGVVGAEAVARILSHGVLPGQRIVMAGDLASRGDELTTLARALERAGASVEGPWPLAELERADGRNQVTSVTLVRDGVRRKLACDLLIVGPRTSASYELAVQAGARTALREGAFELVHPPGAHATWIVGGAAGARSLEEAIAQGARAASEIAASLGASGASEDSR